MTLSLIAACDKIGGIGRKGKLPWHFKEDLKHFKSITTGHVCIMGSKTYEELVTRAKKRDLTKESILPGRVCYVISSTQNTFPGAIHATDIRPIINKHKNDQVFIIGGEKLFIQGLSTADHVYLTVIDNIYNCDRFFPVEHLDPVFEIKEGKVELSKDGTTLYIIRYDRKK